MKRRRVVWSAVLLSAALVLYSLMNGVLSGNVERASASSDCSGKCYGLIRWGGADRAITVMEIKRPTCANCTMSNGWHITRSLWLRDQSSWGTSNCDTSAGCWVEVGATYGNTYVGNSYNCVGGQYAEDCYYWADNRPCGGSYNEHYGDLTQGDYGGKATLEISRDRVYQPAFTHSCALYYITGGVWDLSAFHPSGTPAFSGGPESTYNTMDSRCSGCNITIGAEVYAVGSAFDTHDYTSNEYGFLNWSVNPPPWNWGLQTNCGTYPNGQPYKTGQLQGIGNPPPGNAWWRVQASNANPGGDFAVYCLSC